MKEEIKVRVIGDHPWSGFTGRLVAVEQPIGFLPKMGRVMLDPGQQCPQDHECFVQPGDCEPLKKP